MFPLGRRVGAYLRKLIKAMACTGDGAEPRSVRTTFNWLSPSSTAAMEISSQLKEVFRLIDSNGDGKISPPELCELLLCMGHERATAAQEAEVMVREADCNGDGFIDLDEFMEAVGGGGSGSGGDMSGTREELMEAFRVFDVDGNGFISAEELRTVLVRLGHGKCSLRECRLMIRAVDRNGDGLVDFDEFWSMMTAGACWKVCQIACMARLSSDQLLQLETACGSILYELQIIWDEVGESDAERDKTLLELEQECLDVYRRKVDQANRCRAQLRQAIADSEAELAAICSALGEPPVHIRQSNHRTGSLKEELKSIGPQLEEMRKRKVERWNQFLEVIEQIRKISVEITSSEGNQSKLAVDESDLSARKLEDLYRQLESLQKEKSDRLKQVMEHLSTLNALCSVLGVDFKETVREIHPSLDESEVPKSVSNATIERLSIAIGRLREIKVERMHKLQDLASTMLELWNLMDTPTKEQRLFQNVTSNIAASEQEITGANTLSLDFLNFVEAEVLRLEQLKVSKMKELVLKKKTELEELRRRAHLVAEAANDAELAISAIESGAIDASFILEQIEDQISTVKEEAFSRKDILERVEKWLPACEEEAWLEEYNRDENRYNAGRGAHLALKRAEKARVLVNKIPAMIETLAAKITQWEKERGAEFTYDGVRLLSMLEEYTVVRQEKEQERKRQRDQKKLQGQLIAEQEALYGSKPSPLKPQSAKKVHRTSNGGPSRRLSLGGAAMQPPKPDYLHSAKSGRSTKKMDDLGTLSPGARGLDIAGLPMKKLSFTAHQEMGAPRKPFAPLAPVNHIPSTPSRPITFAFEDNMTSKGLTSTPKTPAAAPMATSKPISSAIEEIAMPAPTPKTPAAAPMPTPSKPIAMTSNAMPAPAPKTQAAAPMPAPSKPFTSAIEENKTLNAMPAPTPKTPAAAPMPMQVATTPAPTCLFKEAAPRVAPVEELEYSFEERRLAFYRSR
ncbi:calcium-binding protein [Musa troglodytarum]|uniref:Calcium-binding protein n=2 Tax=Musa troglodytarum TaxID=320322 RepID=A0A9E7G6I2_9LILI|nr:calcium-binding protein [Musa troglodytarum]